MAQRLQVRFDVEVPEDMPIEAAEEWIAFEVGERNEMLPRHPQMNRELAPIPGTFGVWRL